MDGGGDAAGAGGAGGAAPAATAVAAAAVAVAVVAAAVTAVLQRCRRLVAEEDKVAAAPAGTTMAAATATATATALPLTGVRRRPVVAPPAATGTPTTARDAQQALAGACPSQRNLSLWPRLTGAS